MLRLEHSIGFVIPAQVEGAMWQNVHRLFDNPDHLPFGPQDMPDVQPIFELHSLREGLLALQALARYRQSQWAVSAGHRMLQSVARFLNPNTSWNLERIDYWHRAERKKWDQQDLTLTHGRLIEALVWFYETTADDLALQLADRLARYHLLHTVVADGTIPPTAQLQHTHSWLGTLRGLLLFGELTGQRHYIDAVAATYQNTVRNVVKETGFAPHDFGTDRRGETTSPGDAAQLALWLATRHGYGDYLDDVERIVRARLIPSQITNSPPLRPMTDDGSDEHRDLDTRIIGAFGGMHLEPHAGKHSVTDVTAAGVHTLCDIYNQVATIGPTSLTINLHFTYEDEQTTIDSERNGEAELKVIPRSNKALLIRVPRWTPPESVQLAVNGIPTALTMLGIFAYVPATLSSTEVALRYHLPERTIIESTDNVDYCVAWRGDEITGISPNTDFFPFYPTMPHERTRVEQLHKSRV